MGIRPSVNMNQKRKLKTWVRVVLVFFAVLVVVGGVILAWNFFGSSDVESPGPVESANVLLPPPPAFEDYVLAFPEDPVWSKVVDAPSQERSASINLSALHEVTVIGGFESQAPFPMSCKLPAEALVWPFGATVADGQSYKLAEYGGQEPVDDGAEGITMYTVEGGCQIGTLFVPTDDMLFARR